MSKGASTLSSFMKRFRSLSTSSRSTICLMSAEGRRLLQFLRRRRRRNIATHSSTLAQYFPVIVSFGCPSCRMFRGGYRAKVEKYGGEGCMYKHPTSAHQKGQASTGRFSWGKATQAADADALVPRRPHYRSTVHLFHLHGLNTVASNPTPLRPILSSGLD